MSSSQTNVSRKKITSSKESSSRHDEPRKKTSTSKKEEEKSVTSKSSRRSGSNSDRNSVKQDSVESLNRVKKDKTVNKNTQSSSVNSISRVKNTTSHKILASPRSSMNEIKTKLKTQSNEEKRGVSTIYMPKRSTSTLKQSSPAAVKTSKDLDKGREKNHEKHRSREKSETKAKGSSQEASSSKHRLPSRERRKSRTLSPSEVKMLNRNLNNHGGVSSSKKKSGKHSSSSEYEYEDDFEDYESDFQECTDSDASPISESEENSSSSEEPIELVNKIQNNEEKSTVFLKKYSEEEKMLDSGHYDLQEARRRAARIDLMSASRAHRIPTQSLQRPAFVHNEDPSEKEVRSEVRSLPSSADEGFEDGRSDDFVKSPPVSGLMSMVEDVDAPNINEKPKLTEVEINKESKYLIRGRQLLQMIKLDRVSWSLYESTPIPYDDFIRIHGKMNTRQISTQTNEDNLSVDIQTEEIECRNMWTQFPIVCKSVLKTNEDIKIFTKELVGVGSDDTDVDDLNPHQNQIYYDVLQLNDFLLNAGKLMLALLEGKSSAKMNFHRREDHSRSLPFSEGSIKLSVASVTFLASRPVTLIRYSEVSHKILLTIHDHADEDVETPMDEHSYITDCYIGCLWNIFDPSKPVKIFYSSSNICACCFHPTNYNIVFAGLEDGSMSLWDLGENEFYHRRIEDRENKSNWVIRSPTFTSGGNFEDNMTESSKIVAVTVLSRINNDPSGIIGKFMPVEVCSLNEKGCCMIWSVVKSFEGSVTDDLGQSWWGKLRLFKSHEILLNINNGIHDNFMQEFKDMCLDCIDTNSLYISGNTNKIIHATRIGKKCKPQLYAANDIVGGITCIEKCPFNQPYFLVGCEDGSICLFSSKLEKPLVQLKNPNSTAAIKIIQWSKSKPLIIYVLNVESKIYIWDLRKSDIFPTFNITLENGHVDSMQLSPCRSNHDLINQYITLGYNNGNIEIHKLNQQFQYPNRDQIASDLEVLLKYLSIC
ncbi:WD repeat-containing protein 60 [Chelonus insularis]|uniref:WD repeat-containing protein 60 n=1 Tax=Chelonus insularis TaxID=460826 RepID=UPI0015897CF0|nr:WD repeat-containing protein 60 [Chelonus insularis]